MVLEPALSRFSVTLAVFLGLSLAACDRGAPDAAQESSAKRAATGEIDRSQAGSLMPVASLTDPDGRQLNLGALQGKPVLLNLWATWCAPCVKEMPQLDALAAEYGDKLRVVTVSQDMQGAEKVVPFFAAGGFKQLEPWLDPQAELGFALGGAVLPTTVFYDASGTEVWRVSGEFDWAGDEAHAAIDEGAGS
jgi:thiol-disulfide isomerase/thioredoxin